MKGDDETLRPVYQAFAEKSGLSVAEVQRRSPFRAEVDRDLTEAEAAMISQSGVIRDMVEELPKRYKPAEPEREPSRKRKPKGGK